jgi:PPP family 3-phenylpropionic acid transporter
VAVAAEVVVFFLVGPWLLDRLGPSRAIGIAAVLGAGRWLVSALTLDLTAIALIQPLHGVTFALLHLACMRLLAICVPPQLAATAQALDERVTGDGFTTSFDVAGGAGIPQQGVAVLPAGAFLQEKLAGTVENKNVNGPMAQVIPMHLGPRGVPQ